MATPTQEQISEAMDRHKTNLRAWSKSSGYKYTTVFNTVFRWAGRSDRTPHGGIARNVMRDLAVFIDKNNEKVD